MPSPPTRIPACCPWTARCWTARICAWPSASWRWPDNPVRPLPVPLLVLAGALAVAGCDLGPAFTRPEDGQTARYRETSAAEAAWPDAAWWRGFASPDL